MRNVLIYHDETSAWIAEVPSLPGCGSDGQTKAEAIERVKEAIDLWIEDAFENGEPIPEDFETIALEQV